MEFLLECGFLFGFFGGSKKIGKCILCGFFNTFGDSNRFVYDFIYFFFGSKKLDHESLLSFRGFKKDYIMNLVGFSGVHKRLKYDFLGFE
jgi:hypothetical protein